MTNLTCTVELLRSIRTASQLKASRGITEVMADRIKVASTEPTLLAFAEKLAALMDCDMSYIGGGVFTDFIKHANSPSVLRWIRDYPNVAAMLAAIKDDKERSETTASIEIEDSDNGDGVAVAAGGYDVTITATCLSPLAHGGDQKSGNSTIFRRQNVLAQNGAMLTLPFYGGNAVRGQLRDLIADHFLSALGLTPRRDNPPCALWFFHALYAGGALEENSAAEKALGQLLGKNGAVKAQGTTLLRDMVPPFSLLGTALGNRIIPGRISVGDLRPRCKQWGTGETDASEIMEWTFLTRREDHENHEEHHGMIANTECLKSGTVLGGGIDVSGHATEIERSCLGLALDLLKERGRLGAQNRMGLGSVEIETAGQPDGKAYLNFLATRKNDMVGFLTELGAINAHD